ERLVAPPNGRCPRARRRRHGSDQRRTRRDQAPPARLAARGNRPARAGRRHRAGRAVPRRDHPGRVGRLRPVGPGAVHRLRGLPPWLVVTDGAGGAPPLRPLQHLRPHRRHAHAVRAAPARRVRPLDHARHLVGRGDRRRRPQGAVGRCPAVALGAGLRRPGLGSGVLLRRLRRGRPAARRRHGDGRHRAHLRGRGPVHARWRGLRDEVPRPLAPVVRVPRGVPHLHDPGLRLALRRRLAGDVLAAL
ncbi:MAG: FIG01964566: Predicted membrane protein, hemolysin III homolog, partial [uncultured Nocardioides sp.]